MTAIPDGAIVVGDGVFVDAREWNLARAHVRAGVLRPMDAAHQVIRADNARRRIAHATVLCPVFAPARSGAGDD